MVENFTTNEKIKIMAETVKPILKLIGKRMRNKLDALKAFEGPIFDGGDSEVVKIREIEAVKLRHEIDILKDLSDIIEAMYPEA